MSQWVWGMNVYKDDNDGRKQNQIRVFLVVTGSWNPKFRKVEALCEAKENPDLVISQFVATYIWLKLI